MSCISFPIFVYFVSKNVISFVYAISSEISDINEIESDKEYVERFQLVPVHESQFAQQAYEQHVRVRSSSDSPEGGELAIPNNATVYVHHPLGPVAGGNNENVNGLRYTTAPEVRYEDEGYTTRYEYQHPQHPQHPSNAHNNNSHPASTDDIKIELIRNQPGLHGKVSLSFVLCFKKD